MKNILTVHDCRYLAFPHIYKSGEVNDYWRQMNRSLNRVDVVVAISEFTRQEILKFFSFPEDRVKVIHYGFNPLRSNGISFDQVKEFIATQEIDPPYLLVPSALDPRKNLDRLIEAFAQCKKENKAFPKMVVAGISNEQWNVSDQALNAKNLDVYDDIIVCGIVDRNIMTALIKNAHALCYPSLYEGFGLPPLEGMSLNVPVLAGKSSSIPEVSGNAACLVDPFDIDDISSGLAKIVSNTEYRQNLVAKGKRQIKHFSWDETATQYLNLYRETMSR
jgi:glycosyltransferase involved in cell wall biosynthesis